MKVSISRNRADKPTARAMVVLLVDHPDQHHGSAQHRHR